jgi:hypothetical protein
LRSSKKLCSFAEASAKALCLCGKFESFNNLNSDFRLTSCTFAGMIQKSMLPIHRLLVLTTIALVFVGFFEKRKPQSQTDKKALTEQLAECDADDDNDNELLGGGDCYLTFESRKSEHHFAEKRETEQPVSVCGKKGKTLPKWMMYQQLKIDGPIA